MDRKCKLIQELGLLRKFAAEMDEDLGHFESDADALSTASIHDGITSKFKEFVARSLRTVHTIKGTAAVLKLKELTSSARTLEDLLVLIRDGFRCWDTSMAHRLCEMSKALRQMVSQIAETASGSVAKTPRHTTHMLRYDHNRRASSAPRVAANGTGNPLARPLPEKAAPIPQSTTFAKIASDVDERLFEKLVQLIGQISVVQQQIEECCSPREDAKRNLAFRWLNLIGPEMRDTLAKLPCEPIGDTWNGWPRLLSEMAANCGKQAQIKIEGAEVRLDKQSIRTIQNALTHLLHNAVDHGIERPDVREAMGKPPVATIVLSASQMRDQIQILVKDDGQGVDVERVKQQALRMKLVTPTQAARMTGPELTQFILRPGLSTASQVTNNSGRGIGMDAVVANVEKLGGTLEIHSIHGQGTTIKIKFPLGQPKSV